MAADPITAAASGNLAPTTPGLTGAVSGGNLGPSTPFLGTAASGGNVSPTAPGLTGAASGGNLGPSAPSIEMAASGGNLLSSSGWLIEGMFTPTASGTVLPASISNRFPGCAGFSKDGNPAKPNPHTQTWFSLYLGWIHAPAATTLEALQPKANCVAAASHTDATRVVVYILGTGSKTYHVYNGDSTLRWVLVGDGTMVDMAAEVIPEGARLFVAPHSSQNASIGFIGGLGADWQIDPANWLWVFSVDVVSGGDGAWIGRGPSPATAVWSVFSSSYTVTGVPVFSHPAKPETLSSAGGSNLAPTAPARLTASATGNLAPTAPGAIV
jgi:hypothetical protein